MADHNQYGPMGTDLLNGLPEDDRPDSKGRYNRPWQFSKTKMCKFEIIGMCAKGGQCPFAHSKDDLKPLPDLTCTKLCKTLIHTGSCTNPKCKYAHSKEELRATSTFHKTKLCRFAQIGHCALGVKCNFAHSQEEIRELEQDQKDLEILDRLAAEMKNRKLQSNDEANQVRQAPQMQNAEVPQGIIFPAFGGHLVFPKQPVVVAPGYLGNAMPGLPNYLAQQTISNAPFPLQPPTPAAPANQKGKQRHQGKGGKDRGGDMPEFKGGKGKVAGRGARAGKGHEGGCKGCGRGKGPGPAGGHSSAMSGMSGVAGLPADGTSETDVGVQTSQGNTAAGHAGFDGTGTSAPSMAAGADGSVRPLADDSVAARNMLGGFSHPAMGVMGGIAAVPGLENFDWATIIANEAHPSPGMPGMARNAATGGMGPGPGMSPGGMATEQRRPSPRIDQPPSDPMPNSNARPSAGFSPHGHGGTFGASSMPRVGSNPLMGGGSQGTAPSATSPGIASMMHGSDSFQDGPAYVTSTSSDFVVKNTFLDIGPIGAPMSPIRSIRSAAGRLDMLGGVDETAQHSGTINEGGPRNGVDASTAAAGLDGEGLGQMPRVGSHPRDLHSMQYAQLQAMCEAVQQVDDADAAGGGHERTSIKQSSSSGLAGLSGGMTNDEQSQPFKGGSLVVDQKDDMWQVKNTFLTYTPQVRPMRTVRTAEGALCTLGDDQP